MMRKKQPLALLVLLLAALACGTLPAPPPTLDVVSTNSAQTMQAATTLTPQAFLTPATGSTPTLAAQGAPGVSVTGAAMVVPAGLATTVSSESVAETSGPDLPTWEIHPAYSHITFQGYPLQGTFLQPEIFIYPAESYGQMSAAAAQTLVDLKALLAAPGTLPEQMPFLPVFNAAQVFYSNVANLSFQNGTGVRYLTQYDQALMPVNNNELFYTFQGLTNDRRYYVAAILPVNAPFLLADGTPASPLPPDGVPFDWDNFENMPVYLDAIRQKLETTDPAAFSPNLQSLDALIQSLAVTLP